MSELNGYELSRSWFDFCFENPDIVKPNHTAIFFFAIEHCNRLGWKKKFGFPTTMAMEATGIKSYNTYINSLKDIVSWGFIKMIKKSKNQYSSNVIALSNFDKALDKALDKAFIKHDTKQNESTRQSTIESNDSINKPLTINQKTNKPLTKNNTLLSEIKISDLEDREVEYFEIAQAFQHLFIKNLKEKQAPAKHQENAKFKNYVDPIRLMIESDGVSKEQLQKVFKFLDSPGGEFWKPNILSTAKLREKVQQLLVKSQTLNGNQTHTQQDGASQAYREKIFKTLKNVQP